MMQELYIAGAHWTQQLQSFENNFAVGLFTIQIEILTNFQNSSAQKKAKQKNILNFSERKVYQVPFGKK